MAEQNRQQKMLDDEVMDCSNKLKRAEMLISGLGGEKTRWLQIAKTLRGTYNSLTGNVKNKHFLPFSLFICSHIPLLFLLGDILIAAGIIAYLGPFTAAFRIDQVSVKKLIPSTTFPYLHLNL